MIESLDHMVLTVSNIDRSVEFYTKVLGMQARSFDHGRIALHFGTQKINLHQAGGEIAPHAKAPTTGSADLCFLVNMKPAVLRERLTGQGVTIEQGPVTRTGATGAICSIYVRDPDGNLIELAYPE